MIHSSRDNFVSGPKIAPSSLDRPNDPVDGLGHRQYTIHKALCEERNDRHGFWNQTQLLMIGPRA